MKRLFFISPVDLGRDRFRSRRRSTSGRTQKQIVFQHGKRQPQSVLADRLEAGRKDLPMRQPITPAGHSAIAHSLSLPSRSIRRSLRHHQRQDHAGRPAIRSANRHPDLPDHASNESKTAASFSAGATRKSSSRCAANNHPLTKRAFVIPRSPRRPEGPPSSSPGYANYFIPLSVVRIDIAISGNQFWIVCRRAPS